MLLSYDQRAVTEDHKKILVEAYFCNRSRLPDVFEIVISYLVLYVHELQQHFEFHGHFYKIVNSIFIHAFYSNSLLYTGTSV